VTPAQLGTLLDGAPSPNLWFVPDLAECAGKVVARSAGGDLAFVGRSLDSMFDLLSGALSGVEDAPELQRLSLSFAREWKGRSRRELSPTEQAAARALLEEVGASPHRLARRSRPLCFVDVAATGGTFTDLFELIRGWIEEEQAQWDVIKRKIRFLGVTSRKKTSPNTFRWAQQSPWTAELPRSSILSVSLDPRVWSYLGNIQPKLTRSHAPVHWLADEQGPARGDSTRTALAEAVAVVAQGRTASTRKVIARAMDGEPALADPWLRRLQSRLSA
jgi:hypothetical protein